MTHRAPIQMAIGLALILTLALGCVSKGKYDALIDDKAAADAANAELAASLEAARTDLSGLADQVESLDAELQLEQMDHNMAVQTYDQLLAELSVEVETGKVVIEQMQSGVNVRIDQDILFPSGSADLDEAGIAVIQRVGTELKGTPFQVVVGGYTDSIPIGGRLAKIYPTNWDLAGARASRVVNVLESSGIEGKHLVAVSFGPTNPVASNETADGRAKNRRIEVRIRPVAVDGDTPVAAPESPE